MNTYKGSRNIRLVAIHRGGLLDEATHRLLVSWAADCADHVLDLFEQFYPNDSRPRNAIKTARLWSKGEATVGEARQAAHSAHQAARDTIYKAAHHAARSAGHAVATVHMADHELGAAYYAILAISQATSELGWKKMAQKELRWQNDQLPDSIRDLVLSDQVLRNKKFMNLFILEKPQESHTNPAEQIIKADPEHSGSA